MKIATLALMLLACLMLIGTALAVPPGKTVDYELGTNANVVFDGKAHADKGLKCTDCHSKIFPMKKGEKITMADMNAGKNCGTCHNGEKAFKSSDPVNCVKCHNK